MHRLGGFDGAARYARGRREGPQKERQALNFPAETLALSAAIVAAAYFVFGLTGFGSTVVALPLLVLLFPLKFAVSLLMLLDLAVLLLFGLRLRRGMRLDEIAWLVPFMLAGMAVGLTVLVEAPERPLLITLGIFLLCYAAWGLLRRGRPPVLARAWCAPIGLVGGAFSALFGTGGVLFAIYNAGRLTQAAELRANNAAMILLSSSLRLVLFGAVGLLSQDALLPTALTLAPALVLGFWLGGRLHARVPASAVVKAVYALLVIAGLTLLARSL
ncbi:MAG: sulfite exporter TauE/SafE family protein [Burkholderiales bacterium]